MTKCKKGLAEVAELAKLLQEGERVMLDFYHDGDVRLTVESDGKAKWLGGWDSFEDADLLEMAAPLRAWIGNR